MMDPATLAALVTGVEALAKIAEIVIASAVAPPATLKTGALEDVAAKVDEARARAEARIRLAAAAARIHAAALSIPSGFDEPPGPKP